MIKNTIAAIPMASLSSATLTDTYQPLNGTGLPQPCYMIRFINNSSIDIIISYDGINDHDFVIAGESHNVWGQPNNRIPNYVALMGYGQVIYLRTLDQQQQLMVVQGDDIFLAGYYQPHI